jgi:hypothetical protein
MSIIPGAMPSALDAIRGEAPGLWEWLAQDPAGWLILVANLAAIGLLVLVIRRRPV